MIAKKTFFHCPATFPRWKIIFNFQLNGEVLTIVKEVADYKKATLTAAKNAAVTEAKTKAKEKDDKKNKRETVLAVLIAAGIVEEEIGE